MRITYQGEDFDLPRNFSTTLNRFNVMLSDTGDQTKTFTLPGSPKNLRLAGWSDRIDAVYKPLQDISVLVTDGLMCKICTLSFNAPPSEEDGLNCTLYMGTGEFYSLIEDTKLSALPWPQIKSPDYNTQTLSQRVDYLIAYLKSEYYNQTPESNFYFAPVRTKTSYTWKTGSGVNDRFTGSFYINGFDRFGFIDFTSDPGQDFNFEGEGSQTIILDGKEIAFTKGYGMTPFLKLEYVVGFIFGNYGYTLDMRWLEDILNDNIWAYIGILNNVVDAIYAGILNYNQLFPDITIKNFLTKIEELFAGKFIVNEVSNVVKFMPYYISFISDENVIDLTQYLSSKIKIDTPEFALVQLMDGRYSSENVRGENKLQTEEITINSLTTLVEPIETFKTVGLTNQTYDLLFKCVETERLVHKNSQLIIDGKLTTDEEKSSSEIQLASFNGQWLNADFMQDPGNPNINVRYKTSFEILFQYGQDERTEFRQIMSWYEEYIEFRRYSNIPFTVKMRIPETVLNTLNLQTPKILQGQRVLIESIEQPTGTARELREKQTVTFRTLRSYQDRV